MYTRGPKSEWFDVRDYVEDADSDNDLVQTQYDTVNRMAYLLRDIPLGTLLSERWGTLLPIIGRKNAPEAARLDLLQSPEALDTCMNNLLSFSDMAWEKFFGGGGSCPPPIQDEHHRLWQQGVYLPMLSGCDEIDTARSRAAQRLLDTPGAPERTYDQWFRERRKRERWGDAAFEAVRDAFGAGVLFMCRNGRCCCFSQNRCFIGNPEHCCITCEEGDTTPCGPPPLVDDTVGSR